MQRIFKLSYYLFIKKVSIIGNFFNATNIQVILLSFPYLREGDIQFLLFDKLMDE